MFDRLLVVFSRAPRAEARDKGLPEEPASGFFAAIARGWQGAAARAGARIAICAPPQDLSDWQRALPAAADVVWIEQRGGSFGARLEDAVRRASSTARHVVLTGGDVIPSARALSAAFEALVSGADAVLAPAPDGGVSLLAVPRDADLLRSIARRRRNVLRELHGKLRARSRAVAVVDPLPDVDGRATLRAVEVPEALRPLASALRRACARARPLPPPPTSAYRAPAAGSAVLRGPPVAA